MSPASARVRDVPRFHPRQRREMARQLVLLLRELPVVDRVRAGIVPGDDGTFG